MVLENRHKNIAILRRYSNIGPWLQAYLFHTNGASNIHQDIIRSIWPKNNPTLAVSFWMLWFFLEESEYIEIYNRQTSGLLIREFFDDDKDRLTELAD
jgi:hypothetical protein